MQTDRCSFRVFQSTPDLIRALPLERLEALADALLDFQGPEDLAAWFAVHANSLD